MNTDGIYESGCFVVILENEVPSFYSVLLHEYIHYLQDTCTYFGAKMRSLFLLQNNDLINDIVGFKVSSCGLAYFEPPISIVKDKLCIRDIVLGSDAIKENMAFLAQKYLLPSYDQPGYNWISKFFIEKQCNFLKDNTIIQFALNDISLMTDYPVQSLITLINYLKQNEINVSDFCNEIEIKRFYEICENQLEKGGLLKYDSSIDCTIAVRENISQTSLTELPNFSDILHCIECFCKNNYKLRQNNHSIITEKLIEYKQQSNNHFQINSIECTVFQKVFFETFGYPVINRIDVKKMFNANTLNDLGFTA